MVVIRRKMMGLIYVAVLGFPKMIIAVKSKVLTKVSVGLCSRVGEP